MGERRVGHAEASTPARDNAPRAIALFFGAFSLANALAGSRVLDVWWLDTRWLPSWFSTPFTLAAATLLVAYALDPRTGSRRRSLTVLASVWVGCVAAVNVATFYLLWHGGSFVPRVPVPLSALICLGALWVAVAARAGRKDTPARPEQVRVAIGVAVLAVLFPLAHVSFFGTTDYRAPADTAVVLGAKVDGRGRLSWSVEDRVGTGVELYRQGYVRRLLMSGAVGETGVDEAEAMAAAAVRAGVPAEDILMDHGGVNTEGTVRGTCAMLPRMERVLVVSQGYHLPRIKLAFLAAGREVRTVPAMEAHVIPQTPMYVAREVPGWWVYWARSLVRG